MVITSAKNMNVDGTVINVNLEIEGVGLNIPYTFIPGEPDESFDSEIREWLKVNQPEPYIRDLAVERADKLLKLNSTYDFNEPVTVNGVSYVGGEDSYLKLNEKRKLILETHGTEVKYTDINGVLVTLSVEDALTVCSAILVTHDNRYASYSEKLNAINTATTLEELDLIDV